MFDPSLLVNALERIQNGDKLSVADFAQLRQGLTEQRQLLDLLAGPFRTSKDPSFTYLSADDVWIVHSLLLGSDQDTNSNLWWDSAQGKFQARKGSTVVVDDFTQLATDACIVRKSADQSIPNNAETVVTWDLETYKNPTGMHDNVTNNDRLIAKSHGIYRATLNGRIQQKVSPTVNALRILRIFANIGGAGETQAAELSPNKGDTLWEMSGSITFELEMDTGDYIQARAYQDTGVSRLLYSGSLGGAHFSLVKAISL